MTKFGEGLEQLRTKLLEMSALVEMSILRSIRAVVEKDRVAADEVLKNEVRVNAIELEIDALAIELLALHQPMATNLRFIVAALKINTALERMGDLTVLSRTTPIWPATSWLPTVRWTTSERHAINASTPACWRIGQT